MSFKRINEAIEYLKEDMSYAAIIGAIYLPDIELKDWTKQNVEEQSFNHVYEQKNGGHQHSEDCWSGETLIPLDDKEEYLLMEWSS